MNQLISTAPAEPDLEVGRFDVASDADVEAAVGRARAAFPAWRSAGIEKRSEIMLRFRDLAASRVDGLAHLIATESGKAL